MSQDTKYSPVFTVKVPASYALTPEQIETLKKKLEVAVVLLLPDGTPAPELRLSERGERPVIEMNG